jgi:hypothetical protein
MEEKKDSPKEPKPRTIANKTFPITDDETTNSVLKELKQYLVDNISKLKNQGYWALAITTILAVIIYIDIKTSLADHLKQINDAKNATQAVSYLIFRSAALGTIATTILIFGTKIAISNFDQSMRFTKRKMGLFFLQFLYKQHKQQLNENVSLDQLMASFEIWSKNVESAFSNVKVQTNNKDATSLVKKKRNRNRSTSKLNNEEETAQ